MTRREGLALAGLLWLAVALAAGVVTQPAYMDAYYYFDGALQLARGRGFTEPYLWNYLAPIQALPAPSHLYWMPLTSLAAAPFVAAAEALRPGASNALLFRAAQLPFVTAAASLAGLSGAVTARLGGQRRHIWAAALLTVFSVFYFPFWTTTDSFALFGLCAAGALLVYPDPAAPAARWAGLASGVLAGLAHLARADGVLVPLSLMLYQVIGGLWRARVPVFTSAALTSGFAGRPWLSLVAGYLLVMGPWLARNWLVMGAVLAPGGMRALWLTGYDELFTYRPETLTLARYLAQGWEVIARSKLEAVSLNLQSVIAVQASLVAFPFALVGGWQLRRRPAFQRAALYGALLFLALTLAFTYPGLRGGFFHSGAALLPFILPAAVLGLDGAVAAAARRLRHWQPEKSKPVFLALLTGGVMLLTLTRFLSAAPSAAGADAVYAEIGAWLAAAPGSPSAVTAVNNPPAFYYHTGRPAIAIPANDQATLLEAMAAFDARWLVLDVNVVPALAPLYQAPASAPELQLRATFADSAGRPVYLLELKSP